MLGYDRRDRSNVNDPELVEAVARYLRRHGVEDVAVLEAPTVYATSFVKPLRPSCRVVLRVLSPSYRSSTSARISARSRFERGFVNRPSAPPGRMPTCGS